jgi:hypothetical protein
VYGLKPWLGAVADFSGHYGSSQGFKFQAYNFLFGPELVYGKSRSTFFVRGLVGAAHNYVSGATSTGLEYGGGAGIDIAWRGRLAIRAIQADYLKSRTFGVDQKNLRLSTGLVFHLGAR